MSNKKSGMRVPYISRIVTKRGGGFVIKPEGGLLSAIAFLIGLKPKRFKEGTKGGERVLFFGIMTAVGGRRVLTACVVLLQLLLKQ